MKKIQIKDVQLKPLTQAEKNEMIREVFGEVTDISANTLISFLSTLKKAISEYLIEYDRTWAAFEMSFQLRQKIANTVTNQNSTNAYMKLRTQQGEREYAENFIRTLEKGNLLLEYLRFVLTGQTIGTNFTLKGSKDEIYYVDKSQVDYKITLSTYGGSGNNFVSLAYSVDVKQAIAGLQDNIRDSYKVTGTDIYARIMQVKDEYLRFLETEAKMQGRDVQYFPRYDSTDAEIFDLMKQRLERGDIHSLNRALTMTTYRKMRATMGGRGGYRTSSTQLGDVGLTQDKLIDQKNNSVNFARQTLIRGRFQELLQALEHIDDNPNEIKDTFLRLFTEQKKSVIGDSISRMVNTEAEKMIRSLFK